jgi:hypothetical protein
MVSKIKISYPSQLTSTAGSFGKAISVTENPSLLFAPVMSPSMVTFKGSNIGKMSATIAIRHQDDDVPWLALLASNWAWIGYGFAAVHATPLVVQTLPLELAWRIDSFWARVVEQVISAFLVVNDHEVDWSVASSSFWRSNDSFPQAFLAKISSQMSVSSPICLFASANFAMVAEMHCVLQLIQL